MLPEDAPWYAVIVMAVIGAIGVALRAAGIAIFAFIERDRTNVLTELKASREQNERTQQAFITFLQTQNAANVDVQKMHRQSLDEHTEASKSNNRLLSEVIRKLDRLSDLVEKGSINAA